MNYELITPTHPSEWDVYHAIRRAILFECRGRFGVYDRQHPDEFKSNHFPKLFLFERTPVGVIRIDIDAETARFRRVAIVTGQQRRGHGRMLLCRAEAYSAEHSVRRVEASVAADAVGFYRRCGYEALKVQDAAGSIGMFKNLGAE